MDIKTIGVIGAGQMGSGITQVAAASGFSVIVNDISDEILEHRIQVITANIDRAISRGKMPKEQRDLVIDRITTCTELSTLADVDFVIEAAPENEQIKFDIFKKLDEICRQDVILATNTSSIPIGRIGHKTRRPDKVIGMHFMNPVPAMRLVEIIRSLITSDFTFETTWELSEKLGKTPALANDYPGFISNRIIMPMINEAIYCLHHGVGKREDIDTVMRLGANHPMGPLALADLIGLDTCLAILETLYEGFQDSKYRACPLLRKYVEAGRLGRKTGEGFYTY